MTGVLLYDIGTAIYIVGLLVGIVFGLHYGWSAPWWRSAVGRMFVVITLALLVAGATVVVQILVPLEQDDHLRLALRLLGYGSFAVAMSFLLGTYLHERRQPTSPLPIRKEHDMSESSQQLVQVDERPAAVGTPTQVANPVRTTVRTIVQNLIVLVPLVNAVALVLVGYLQEQTDLVVPGWAFAVLNGVVLVTGLLIGGVTRIMAIPGVAEWIREKLPWLAAIPVKKV